MSKLKIALPKGTLFNPTKKLLEKAKIDISSIKGDSRKLVYKTEKYDFLLCRPSDVTTYVEYGAADIGIVGKDALLEGERDVYELADLGFGKCEFIVAVPDKKKEKVEKNYKRLGQLRVATKYDGYAEKYFLERGIQAEIIKLKGAVEIAPIVDLADVIFDLMQTGKTLEQNKLSVIDKGDIISARLIANWVANKIKSTEVQLMTSKLLASAKKLRYI